MSCRLLKLCSPGDVATCELCHSRYAVHRSLVLDGNFFEEVECLTVLPAKIAVDLNIKRW
jgi:hypothetical protein